jgi:transposase-like protein
VAKRLERNLGELLSFFSCPRPLWRRLRTTSIIARYFFDEHRRTRPMVCFTNVDRIIGATFNGMKEKYQMSDPVLQLFYTSSPMSPMESPSFTF